MKIVLYIAYAILSALLNGYVLNVLWGWFIVSTFGAVPINIPQALGVFIVVRLMTFDFTAKQETLDAELMVKGLLWPLICLFFGYVYTLFM